MQFILLPCIHAMNRRASFICIKIFNQLTSRHKYTSRTISVSNFLKPSQQELFGPSLSKILIALFWIMKTFLIDEDEPQKVNPTDL
jgi:hypothetical protein